MSIPKWLSRFGEKVRAKIAADNDRVEDEMKEMRDHFRALARAKMIAEERHRFIREFCVHLLSTAATARFLAVSGIYQESAAALRRQLEAMYLPDWHDGNVVLAIAEAAWNGYATARYGFLATSPPEVEVDFAGQ